jgi:branched-subunit amino acid transport protein
MTAPTVMESVVVAVVAVSIVTFALRAAGPAVLGDRRLPRPFARIIELMAPVLLVALLVTELGGAGWRSVDWTLLVGVGAAGIAKACRAPMIVAAIAGIAVTALLRFIAS